MPIMEISVVPLGTKSPSVSKYVAACVDQLRKEKAIRYEITPMATIVEASNIKKLLRVAEKMHKSVLKQGIKRVVTTIKIDDRIDKELTMKGKVESVTKRAV